MFPILAHGHDGELDQTFEPLQRANKFALGLTFKFLACRAGPQLKKLLIWGNGPFQNFAYFGLQGHVSET